MSAAKASGTDAGGGGGSSSTNRSHKPGNQSRTFTVEQKAAVIRVRKCGTTAFYEILAIERTASEGEIKKAYRKLSLLTHPDKNGYDGADEAFKMVSRAFQVLSDPDKKAKFDRFGGDPDSRFGAGSAGGGGPGGGAGPTGNPFEGFARASRGGGFGGARGPMFEEEITPEELFNRFFGGGGGGGFGPFGGGGFGGENVFFMGGGPGIRVHQFGGRPRRRPRGPNDQEEGEQSPLGILANMLPLIILFGITMLSSLLSAFGGGESAPKMPEIRLSGDPPFTVQRTMPYYKVPYWLKPDDANDMTGKVLRNLDSRVEKQYIGTLQMECSRERRRQEDALQSAMGWFFHDEAKLKAAQEMELEHCNRLMKLKAPLMY